MRVYGLVNVPLRKVVDLYATGPEAELALERVVADEPAWSADLAVHELELEVQEDGVRLRTPGAALIDVWYGEATPPSEGEARAEPGQSRTGRLGA